MTFCSSATAIPPRIYGPEYTTMRTMHPVATSYSIFILFHCDAFLLSSHWLMQWITMLQSKTITARAVNFGLVVGARAERRAMQAAQTQPKPMDKLPYNFLLSRLTGWFRADTVAQTEMRKQTNMRKMERAVCRSHVYYVSSELCEQRFVVLFDARHSSCRPVPFYPLLHFVIGCHSEFGSVVCMRCGLWHSINSHLASQCDLAIHWNEKNCKNLLQWNALECAANRFHAAPKRMRKIINGISDRHHDVVYFLIAHCLPQCLETFEMNWFLSHKIAWHQPTATTTTKSNRIRQFRMHAREQWNNEIW